MNYPLIATAAFGLEGIVRRELEQLGYEARTENGFVRFGGTLEDAFKANLWLRTADRVLILMAEGPVMSFEDLFRLVRGCPWQELMPRDATIPVSCKCARSQLMSPSDCQAIAKKALTEELMAYYHMSWCAESGPRFPIHISIHQNQARVMVDTSGDALNRRGYRTWNGEAPLRETLAAALAEKEIVIATETGGGVVPVDADERRMREEAGRLSCMLAERADTVIRVCCGLPQLLKGVWPCESH